MTETESFLRDMAALKVEKITFSTPCGENIYKKSVIRRLNDGFQTEHFTEKQAFHENFPVNQLEEKLSALFPTLYRQAHFVTEKYFMTQSSPRKGSYLPIAQKIRQRPKKQMRMTAKRITLSTRKICHRYFANLVWPARTEKFCAQNSTNSVKFVVLPSC